MMKLLLPLLLSLSANPASASNESFDKIKTLQGTWTLTMDGVEYDDVFTVEARGTAVVDRTLGYIVVYTEDGDSVLLSAFLSGGGSHRMRSKPQDTNADRLEFEYLDSMGAHFDAGTITRVVIDFVDANTVFQHWYYKAPGSEVESGFDVPLKRKP